ncbi:hypothetical protein L6452_30721 [Arctium lappa]|uniref:Uncharacterized protein n=1 Tax=Arctium lappa TaxID=4217 RepID=A0ACB8ZIR2_ARCLA|nr:hypothetical protein L6452_30721 [Arctium lappa]
MTCPIASMILRESSLSLTCWRNVHSVSQWEQTVRPNPSTSKIQNRVSAIEAVRWFSPLKLHCILASVFSSKGFCWASALHFGVSTKPSLSLSLLLLLTHSLLPSPFSLSISLIHPFLHSSTQLWISGLSVSAAENLIPQLAKGPSGVRKLYYVWWIRIKGFRSSRDLCILIYLIVAVLYIARIGGDRLMVLYHRVLSIAFIYT